MNSKFNMTDGIELGFYYQYAIFMDTFLDPPPQKKNPTKTKTIKQTNKKAYKVN